MLVLNVCKQVCPEKIDFKIINRLGDGADGEVFELEDNKVLKLCIYNTSSDADAETKYKYISDVLLTLKNNNAKIFASVYEFGHLGKYTKTLYNNEEQKYILYYYIMEKLNKISEDEKKVFHSILSHEDRGLKKNFSILKIKEMLRGMSKGLDFDTKRVIFFCENIAKQAICHNDIHPRNIMKDNSGNFKLIDFDRCELKLS